MNLYAKTHNPTPITRRDLAFSPNLEPWLYVVVIAIAQFMYIESYVIGSAALCYGLLVWLLYRGCYHPSPTQGRLCLSLTVVPVVRIVSDAVLPMELPNVWYFVVADGILFISGITITRVCGYSLKNIGISIGKHFWIIPFIILSGWLVGWFESQITSRAPLINRLTFADVWFTAGVLIICTGFVEEFIFRGILLNSSVDALTQRWGILFSTVVWGLLTATWLSWEQVLVISCTGVLWGAIRHYCQSIIPLSLAHGLANFMLFVVFPNLHK